MLTLADIQTRCEARIAAAPLGGLLLIEGAGGVMSPIAEDGLNLDLIAALKLPVVLAAANYLGAISHTLTAFSTLQTRGITVQAVVLQTLSNGGPPLEDTLAALGQFAPQVPLFAGPGWETRLIASL